MCCEIYVKTTLNLVAPTAAGVDVVWLVVTQRAGWVDLRGLARGKRGSGGGDK